MATKYFTVAEANALLPKIEPLMAHLLEKRALVSHTLSGLDDLLEDTLSGGVGNATASQMAADFVEIEKTVAKLHEFGCIVKDINVGLLDFLAEINGREVYLCWKYGEPAIEYYHDLQSGFNGRRPVPQ